jgi:recombination protein RecT
MNTQNQNRAVVPASTNEQLAVAEKFIASNQRQIQSVMTSAMEPKRTFRIMAQALTRTPKLFEVMRSAPETIIDSVIRITQMGLEVDGRRAHLVPFFNGKTGRTECQAIIDYKGLVELVRRSGDVSYIHADIVCENDKFSYAYGSKAHLDHIPAIGDRGDTILCYSFVKMKDGSEDFIVMSVDEVDEIRKRSQGFDKKTNQFRGPHAEWPDEMRKKTVFRRHTKWLTLSPEARDAIELDAESEVAVVAGMEAPTTKNITPRPEPALPPALANEPLPQPEPQPVPAEQPVPAPVAQPVPAPADPQPQTEPYPFAEGPADPAPLNQPSMEGTWSAASTPQGQVLIALAQKTGATEAQLCKYLSTLTKVEFKTVEEAEQVAPTKLDRIVKNWAAFEPKLREAL